MLQKPIIIIPGLNGSLLINKKKTHATFLGKKVINNALFNFDRVINYTLNTNTDGTSFVLRHTADIFRNDDDAPHLNWQMTDRKITMKSV